MEDLAFDLGYLFSYDGPLMHVHVVAIQLFCVCVQYL